MDKVDRVNAGGAAEGVLAKGGASSSCNQRTVVELRDNGNTLDLPLTSMPRGPWHDAEAAKGGLRLTVCQPQA